MGIRATRYKGGLDFFCVSKRYRVAITEQDATRAVWFVPVAKLNRDTIATTFLLGCLAPLEIEGIHLEDV